jgi:hypothetical protein
VDLRPELVVRDHVQNPSSQHLNDRLKVHLTYS